MAMEDQNNNTSPTSSEKRGSISISQGPNFSKLSMTFTTSPGELISLSKTDKVKEEKLVVNSKLTNCMMLRCGLMSKTVAQRYMIKPGHKILLHDKNKYFIQPKIKKENSIVNIYVDTNSNKYKHLHIISDEPFSITKANNPTTNSPIANNNNNHNNNSNNKDNNKSPDNKKSPPSTSSSSALQLTLFVCIKKHWYQLTFGIDNIQIKGKRKYHRSEWEKLLKTPVYWTNFSDVTLERLHFNVPLSTYILPPPITMARRNDDKIAFNSHNRNIQNKIDQISPQVRVRYKKTKTTIGLKQPLLLVGKVVKTKQ